MMIIPISITVQKNMAAQTVSQASAVQAVRRDPPAHRVRLVQEDLPVLRVFPVPEARQARKVRKVLPVL